MHATYIQVFVEGKNRLSSITAFMANFLPDLSHISKNIP